MAKKKKPRNRAEVVNAGSYTWNYIYYRSSDGVVWERRRREPQWCGYCRRMHG